MRYRRFLGILPVAAIAIAAIVVAPLGAHAADYLANARLALQKGDLRAAQVQLLNAVKTDPQNAEARFLLARVEFDLGDPVAAEREVRNARDRGFDQHKTLALLSQAMLAQSKFQEMLNEFKPTGKDKQLELRDPGLPRHRRGGAEPRRRRREGFRRVGEARADLGAAAAG